MLPFRQKVLFLLFALTMGLLGLHGFRRLYLRIAAGREDTEPRTDHVLRRVWYSLATTLTQRRTFRKRPWISFFHSLIFYGFIFYILVNVLDALDGFVPVSVRSLGIIGELYVLAADLLSAAVLFGVTALVLRRFLLPSSRDFRFNDRTLLHKDLEARYTTIDSLIVSAFILFHVGSRAIGAGAKLAAAGPDAFAPFATLLSHLFTVQNAQSWSILGYWGALGSVLAFLVYFPYTKHIHIFLAPTKYLVAREAGSGVLPAMALSLETEEPKLGASKLEDLAWPRLLDAYACIQCNRCQDVCPATATGKSLSPSALEINKRMELNDLGRKQPSFEKGEPSPNPLLTFALSPEALWACTTCGACVDVCPVQDEPMLDIIDIRRNQVMMEGKFPSQLQSAFRSMERAKNPWGISQEKRLDWAAGLDVKTTEQNASPDVLFWVGCAPSYDPQSQKTARALVQLFEIAGVDFAVLGKQECCTGDSARRAGNEYLYWQLASANIDTLNRLKPKLIVTTCPHCMNTVGQEYKQLGGDFKVIHHTEYLESLVDEGKLSAVSGSSVVAYHDPCYLGRHNSVYDAPRNLLNILSNSVVELPRNRENGFCCGAGGAQFWKDEEEGTERISDNRYREAEQQLQGTDSKVLAVGCPFCKSMLESTPGKTNEDIVVRDVAELLLEGVQRKAGGNRSFTSLTEQYPQAGQAARSGVEIEPAGVENTAVTEDASVTAMPVTVARIEKPGDVSLPVIQHIMWAPREKPEAKLGAAEALPVTNLDVTQPVSIVADQSIVPSETSPLGMSTETDPKAAVRMQIQPAEIHAGDSAATDQLVVSQEGHGFSHEPVQPPESSLSESTEAELERPHEQARTVRKAWKPKRPTEAKEPSSQE